MGKSEVPDIPTVSDPLGTQEEKGLKLSFVTPSLLEVFSFVIFKIKLCDPGSFLKAFLLQVLNCT